MNDNILIPGLLIAVCNFPHIPTASIRAKYWSFWTSLFSITRHNTNAPIWSRLVGQTSLPPEIFQTQTSLLTWFLLLSDSPAWHQVDKFTKDPKHWGPYMWSLIHGVAHLVRPSDGLYFGEWLRLIPAVLPCDRCAGDFSQILSTTPGIIQGRDAKHLAMRLHNKVSSKLPGHRNIQIGDITTLLNKRDVSQIPIPASLPISKKKTVVKRKQVLYTVSKRPRKKKNTPLSKNGGGCGCGGK